MAAAISLISDKFLLLVCLNSDNTSDRLAIVEFVNA